MFSSVADHIFSVDIKKNLKSTITEVVAAAHSAEVVAESLSQTSKEIKKTTEPVPEASALITEHEKQVRKNLVEKAKVDLERLS